MDDGRTGVTGALCTSQHEVSRRYLRGGLRRRQNDATEYVPSSWREGGREGGSRELLKDGIVGLTNCTTIST